MLDVHLVHAEETVEYVLAWFDIVLPCTSLERMHEIWLNGGHRGNTTGKTNPFTSIRFQHCAQQDILAGGTHETFAKWGSVLARYLDRSVCWHHSAKRANLEVRVRFGDLYLELELDRNLRRDHRYEGPAPISSPVC